MSRNAAGGVPSELPVELLHQRQQRRAVHQVLGAVGAQARGQPLEVGRADLQAREVEEVRIAGELEAVGIVNAGVRDVRSTYANELAVAADAPALVDRVDLLLMAGKMSPTLKASFGISAREHHSG